MLLALFLVTNFVDSITGTGDHCHHLILELYAQVGKVPSFHEICHLYSRACLKGSSTEANFKGGLVELSTTSPRIL